MEKELGLGRVKFDLSNSAQVETFLEIEKQLQREVESSLLQDADEDLVAVAKARQSSFWSEHLPNVQAHWSLVAAAGQLLLEASHVEKSMKSLGPGADAILNAYTSSDRPWCLMDTFHRHMERRWQNFEFGSGNSHELLEQLVVKARQRFMEVGGKLSETFVRRLQDAGFAFSGLRQRDVYAEKVKPWIGAG